MKQALGLVEIQGMSTAVVVADTMVKAANIRIIAMENTRGLGYMTIKIAGDVGAVNAAVNAGCQVGLMHGKLVSSKVIPRPSDYVEKTFCNPEPPAPDSPPGKKAEAGADTPEPPAEGPDAEATLKAVTEPVKELKVEAVPETVAEPEVMAETTAETETQAASEEVPAPETAAEPETKPEAAAESETKPEAAAEPGQPEAAAEPEPPAAAAADTATAAEAAEPEAAEAEPKKPAAGRSAAKKTGTPKNKK